ncbi:YeaH/YhbH family protein [Plasticicumulans acidivorans]|uniref:UPF0229 protein C7443_11613 n=1 Tax=Plasticicumulans acidivorans TaxID=886464 RepID=A0A317MPW2_9GAMM|nr:YeaH/YhbH family protein [Plasticicumulans acidivorans]PWV58507.1 hypothetical protein C7443_11613 [Plasticicumulans acidivorans]
MSHLVDRRLNGKNRSAVNRQRFLRRFKDQLKRAVADAMSGRSITNVDSGEKVSIPTRDLSEPVFSHGPGGRREAIHPGNKEFNTGDRVKRPQGGGGGGGGRQASQDGEGEDDFVFELSRDEFLDLFFEDLALPDMIKTQLAKIPEWKSVRAGYTNTGVPANINVVRSMKGALARRTAIGAPYRSRLRDLERELEETVTRDGELCADAERLREEIRRLRIRIDAIPFIDTFDLRYNNRVREPKPTTQAVMFCVMDVSGSMDQERKDLGKRFFTLLYLFLTRNYEHIEVVFIRHHTVAKEVDEQEFFYSRETGGTVVSSALNLTADIISERYSPSAWNIYVAQASDGDNWQDDSPNCREILLQRIMPFIQYFAYVEITPDRHQSLWEEYLTVQAQCKHFALQEIGGAEDIYPVFRELFKRRLA